MAWARTLVQRTTSRLPRRIYLLPASQQHTSLFHPRSCSSVAAEPEPAEPVAETSNLIPGHADSAGTAQYAQRIGAAAGSNHFRQMKAGSKVGELLVSSLGIGTFGGSETEEVDRDYIKTISRGFDLGINLIDTASNYRSMRSELAVGRCLAKSIEEGKIKRNEVVVCTKGGFLSYDYRESVDARTFIENKYVKSGLFQWEEFVGGVHSLSTPFVLHQLECSRRNLGLQTIDVFLIQNPEMELNIVARQTVLSRLRSLFTALEQAVADGKISMYGVSTWNAFKVSSSLRCYISLEEMTSFAKDAAGSENHHFKVVMVPFNLALQDVANNPIQNIKGRRLPMLHAAAHLNHNVLISSPLYQGSLVKGVATEAKDKFTELGDTKSDAQVALQFTRTTPGVMTTVVGMSKLAHLEENAAIVKRPANYRGL